MVPLSPSPAPSLATFRSVVAVDTHNNVDNVNLHFDLLARLQPVAMRSATGYRSIVANS